MIRHPSNAHAIGAVLIASVTLGACDRGDASDHRFLRPVTRVATVVDTMHGVAIPDPYRWLEDQDAPETRQWIEAQHVYTGSHIAAQSVSQPIADRLFELRAVAQVNPRPMERNGRFLMWKRDATDYSYLHIRDGVGGTDELLWSLHSMQFDSTEIVLSLDWSRDGRYLAYGVRKGGIDAFDVRVHDLEVGKSLPDRLPAARYTSVSFAGDDLIYATYGDGGCSVRHHRLRTASDQDSELFNRDAADEFVTHLVADDDRTVLIEVHYGTSRSELHLVDLAGEHPRRTLVDDIDAVFSPQFAGERVVIDTDWEAPNRRVLVADLANPAREHWREIVPEGPDAIDGVSAVGGRLYVHRLRNVASSIETYDIDGEPTGSIDLSGIGSASRPFGTWDGTSAFYSFSSLIEPRTISRIDTKTGEVTEWARDEIEFDSSRYVLHQEWFTSPDGTQVPMLLAHRKDLDRTGDHPTLLSGYGSSNLSVPLEFSPFVAVWLENGGVYAWASIRGGGEFGEPWHRAGMRENKQNVFDDFIAAAEYLIRKRYTNPSRLAIRGRSAGGLLVGACLTQRPDLYRAVLCEYPVLDVIRYAQANPLTVQEFGSSADPEQFRFLHKYSPYQRVTDGTAYPAVLLTTGDNDTRVPPHQARKMAARLQVASTSGHPVMLMQEIDTGHSRASWSQTQLLRSEWCGLTFLFWQLGMSAG